MYQIAEEGLYNRRKQLDEKTTVISNNSGYEI